MNTSTRVAARDRRAFATVAAVVLIGMAGMVFVALTALVGHDLRRTARAGAEAQLRQLLTAGEVAAAASLDRPAGAEEVAVPAALAADGAKLTVARGDAAGDERPVTVDAAFRGLRTSQ